MKYNWWESLMMFLRIDREPIIQEVVQKPTKPELVVGEPVLSFVALVNSDPKRFKMRAKKVHLEDTYTAQMIFDKTTKEWFWLYRYEYTWCYVGSSSVIAHKYYSNLDFLTQDEMKYIDNNICRDYNIKVVERWMATNRAKAKRLDLEARQRLIDIYCNASNK